MSFSEEHFRGLFGDEPSVPSAPREPWRPRLTLFAGISRAAARKAPPRELLYWRVIGAAFLLICCLSTGAATVTWSIQTGHSIAHVLYVPLIWFPLILTLELVIAVSIRPNQKGLVALLVAMRIALSLWIGYQIAEPAVVYLNQSAVARQLAYDNENTLNTRVGTITKRWNKQIAKLQTAELRLLKRENAQAYAVHYWRDLATCAPSAAKCVQLHAYRLEQAEQDLTAEKLRDAPTLASLSARINADRVRRDQAIGEAVKTIANSTDIWAREGALEKLMASSFWMWLWVWGLRGAFLIVDLTPCFSKIAIVRKGTVADKSDEADELQANIAQKYRWAQAWAKNVYLDRVIEVFPQLVDDVLKIKARQFVSDVTAQPKLQSVPPMEPTNETSASSGVGSDRDRGGDQRLEDELAAARAAKADAERRLDDVLDLLRAGTSPENRYELLRPLGSGALGRVGLYLDHKQQRQVAIKVGNEIGPEQRRWMREEQAKLEKLRHPNIVAVLDSFVFSNGRPAIVLEYVAGSSLRDALYERIDAGARFTVPETLSVARPVCEALDYLHGQALLHNDVKPANVLGWGSGDEREIRVADFHVSALMGTTPALRGGTTSYMSPEQIEGKVSELDARSDLYPVGVIMFEMLAGARLFGDEGLPQYSRDNPPSEADIAKLTANIPLAKIIASCLAKDRERRPLSARQLVDELRKSVGQLPTPIHDSVGSFAVPDELNERRRDPDETPPYHYRQVNDEEGGR